MEAASLAAVSGLVQVLLSVWLCLSGIASGGQAVLAYSGGAKDLSGISWPAMSGDHFAVPALAEGFSYDRSGMVKGIGDASGLRSLGYLRGRLATTNWTAGALRGYKVERGIDATGRGTGFTLRRDGAVIHSTDRGFTGVSDQVAGLSSGALKVLPQRDAQGRLTGYQWGSATGTFIPRVTQTWSRGAGGRIEAAGSDVGGAPSFDYLIDGQPLATSFDSRDRHLKCKTAGRTWTYEYDSSGQLKSATRDGSPELVIDYVFDGIGRRDKGEGNLGDLLNRTVAWTNSQAKTLRIDADPAAQVSVNGTAVTGFTGSYTLSLASPGPQGGWVPWTTVAVLPGQGEGAGTTPVNALASPDAKAQKSGATWIPPVNETIHYDAAGNRLDSAQWEYGWDAKDQLVRARTKDWKTAPQGWDLRFAYDSEGRRFRKEVTRYAAGAVVEQKTVTYVWDGWDIVYERQQLSSGLTILERKYVWGEGLTGGGREMNPGGLLLIRETKGDSSLDLIPLYDGTGHVTALTNLDGDLLASYAYGPFGEPMGATGPRAAGNPWRYATKYRDEETGLYYFGHRYYDPVTGQWLNREPLGESESINLYSYCHNDPVNKVDRLGMSEVAIGTGNVRELALSVGLIHGFEDDDFLVDVGVLNSRLTAGGGIPIQMVNGLPAYPCMVCHGRGGGGTRLEGVSSLYSFVGGEVHSSTGNADMMRKIAAGAWGDLRALPKDVGNVADFFTYGIYYEFNRDTALHPAFHEPYFDADGSRVAGQQQVYPGISSDDLLVRSGGAFTQAATFVAGPEVLAQSFKLAAKVPGWSVRTVSNLSRYRLVPGVNMPLFGLPQFELRVAESGGFTTFYHGTSSEAAAAIRANGIDLSFSRTKLDFGKGFYVTRDLTQAQEWAVRQGGEVLTFKVPNSQLSQLSHLQFPSANGAWADFVSVNRGGAPLHGYEAVSGPMLGNPRAFMNGATPASFGQQTSLHSDAAIRLFIDSLLPQ